MYILHFTKQAQKDALKIKQAGFKDKTQQLLENLKLNPYNAISPYEKLIGNLKGAYSRRISLQHRLVYQVLEEEKVVKILRLWTHYE